ncbi:MAG: hypothetical protein JJT82_03885 [Legionellaceae bacterium]|nr:hypothetical protein [Legionellaceae bacterium]
MNREEIHYKAKVLAWRDRINHTPSARTQLKNQLLYQLKRQDARDSWEHIYHRFEKFRTHCLAQDHQQGWFWQPRFHRLKQFVSQYISQRLGHWLQGFFRGSPLRTALDSSPEHQIRTIEQSNLTLIDTLENQWESLMRQPQSLTSAALHDTLQRSEEHKCILGFSAYCRRLAWLAHHYPVDFIAFYEDKLQYPGEDYWASVVLHYWADAVVNYYMPSTTELHPKLHSAAQILLLLTQHPRADCALGALPVERQDVDSVYHELQERLKTSLKTTLDQYDYLRISHSLVAKTNALHVPVHLLAQASMDNTEQAIIVEALGRVLILEIAITGSQQEETDVWHEDSFAAHSLATIRKFCKIERPSGAAKLHLQSAADHLEFLNPWLCQRNSIASPLNHAEYIFSQITKTWLKIPSCPQDLVRTLGDTLSMRSTLSPIAKEWLLLRLQTFHHRFKIQAPHVESAQLDEGLQYLCSAIEHHKGHDLDMPGEGTLNHPVKPDQSASSLPTRPDHDAQSLPDTSESARHFFSQTHTTFPETEQGIMSPNSSI